jgi:DNA-directed RNA polymerase alpha subunit
MAKKLFICEKGHRYYKVNCTVCPVCEAESKGDYFLSRLGAPARRALQGAGIDSIARLSEFTEKELLALHGFGPSSIPTLKAILKEHNLSFRK